MRHLTYRNSFAFILIFLNLLLLTKVNFFIPLLSGHTPLHDFDNYYHLTDDLLQGINPYQVSYMRTWGPPLVFLYHLPFQFLDLESARAITSLINIAAGVACSLFLCRKLTWHNQVTAFLGLNLILFSSFPGRFSLEMGQPNLVLMLLITAVLFTQKENVKSVFLGVLISFKTHFILSLFAYVKRNKVVFYKSIFTTLLIAFIASVLIKPGIYLYYYKYTLPELLGSSSRISGTDYYNQTYFSTLARLGITFPDKNFYSAALLVCAFIIYLIANFEIAIIFSVIFSIISWQHYYVVLFPIYIKALRDSPKNFYDYIFVSILIVFWWIEFPWLHQARLTTFNGLLASHYFLSAFLLSVYIFLIRSRINQKNGNFYQKLQSQR